MEYSSSSSLSRQNLCSNTRKKKKKNKMRFSDEQIRSLESIFESESKVEPRKKLELARELGLQPRQVAIWFQNKRARWKSKQLEQDYNVLQAKYNTLASLFETLKKENHDLNLQLQKMNDVMQNPQERSNCIEGESDAKYKSQVVKAEQREVVSDDGSCIKSEYFGLEEEEDDPLINMARLSADASLTSTENWGDFDTDALFAESSSNYHWSDFWS